VCLRGGHGIGSRIGYGRVHDDLFQVFLFSFLIRSVLLILLALPFGVGISVSGDGILHGKAASEKKETDVGILEAEEFPRRLTSLTSPPAPPVCSLFSHPMYSII
jgi:hypothetical protein